MIRSKQKPITSPSEPKTKKAQRFVSIQAKIGFWGALALILASAAVIAISAYSLRQKALENAVQSLSSEGQQQSRQIIGQLEKALTAGRTMANSFAIVQSDNKRVQLSREQVNSILIEVLDQNPDFLGTYVGWEPNAFDGQDSKWVNKKGHDATGRFIPYWWRGKDGKIYLDPLLDYDKPGIGDYYLVPKATKTEQVIAPYLYPYQGEQVWITSWVAPIVVNGRFYGIAGVDYRVDFIQALADSYKGFKGQGALFVVDNNGNVVGATKAAQNLGKNFEKLDPDFGSKSTKTSLNQSGAYSLIQSQHVEVHLPFTIGAAPGQWKVVLQIPKQVVFADVNRQLQQLIGLGALVGMLGLIILLMTLRQTIAPIGQITQLARRLGDGDLSQLSTVRSSDEIGVLAQALNASIERLRGMVQTEQDRDNERTQRERLQSNIREFLEIAGEIAQGDLTKRGKVTDDMLGNVVDAVNLSIEEIGFLLSQVRQVAESVNQGASEMTQTNLNILQGAQAQAEVAQQTDAQATQVTTTMRAMTENAVSSAQAARQTLEASTKGQEALQNTLSGMQSIRREVQSISRNIKGLSDRSQEISEVVDTIDTIAKQTHLLALNAALEAAGAGEAGARFGVVARQVRKLAEDTAKSTNRVGLLIKGVQSEIQGLVLSVEGGTREVEQGYRIANEAGDRLKEIATLANQSARLAELMSDAAVQQVSNIEQVNHSVKTIAGTASQTEEQSQKGQEAAHELRQLSEQLTQSLSRFRLPG